MPRAPERPCRNAVCPKTTADAGGYCAACRPASGRAEREQRGSSTARGYGYSWQQRRARIIQRDPVCASCKRAWSTEVDHVQPKAQGGTDDETNLQGLCKPCHSTKTAREDGGFGRAPRQSAHGVAA
jgi:5-methylcytosine-specific restriction protein A